ncbi:unnamed protein product, partial [Prorocentrum cordatum]
DEKGVSAHMDEQRTFRYFNEQLSELQRESQLADVVEYKMTLQDVTRELMECHSAEQLQG